MSEHLKQARWLVNWMTREHLTPEQQFECLLATSINLTAYLEAQNPPAETQQSEQPSSQATETAEETEPIYSTSLTLSSPVNPDGLLELSVVRVIEGWLSSVSIPGSVLGVEIGVTLTSKASTPPVGSPSPSTAAPTREGNGAAGKWEPIMWINLETREMRETQRDKHGRFKTSDHPEFDPSVAPASTSPAEDASREGRWWKAGPFFDGDGQQFWAVRRSPIGLGVAERIYDEKMADRIVALYGEHQAFTRSETGASDKAGKSANGELVQEARDER